MSAPSDPGFSVLVLTLNEEHDLPACLASLRGCDDVVVLDSGSTDRTAELATAAGARLFTRSFDDFAGQRNFAHASILFRHEWVFHLDADEKMTPELAEECRAAATGADVDGYYVAPRMIFQDRWIPHCTDYPAYQARFVHAGRFRFVQVGHGQREAPGMRMGRLRWNYLHDLSSGGEAEWIDRHRRYARDEARLHASATAGARWSDLCSREPLVRRRALKRLSYRLPQRGALRFIYQYVLRAGFLDGAAGLRYCRLLADYEVFAAEEYRRLRQAAS